VPDQNLDMVGDNLLIQASVPSADLKNRVWDQIKLVDPNFFDLIADIQAPAAAVGVTSTLAARTYSVKPGDSLSKIGKQLYGDANMYKSSMPTKTNSLTQTRTKQE
jgi:LysM repeat protein